MWPIRPAKSREAGGFPWISFDYRCLGAVASPWVRPQLNGRPIGRAGRETPSPVASACVRLR